jgi:cytochrome c-type biogenesis protein CcmH
MQFWFWIALLTLAALCFVIVPLLRKSAGKEIVTDAQRAENLRLFGEREAEIDADFAAGIIDSEGHGALIRELQLSLLDDVELGEGAEGSDFDSSGARPPWLLLAVVAVILPALAVSLYQRWGYIEDVELMSLFQRTLEAQGDPSQAQALVVDLGEVVKEDSERPWAWYFLGENFASLGMFNEAQIAYLQAAERLQGAPEESLVLGRAALALYIKSGFEFSPELDALVARAREINPSEIAVLQLLAADAQNREDYAAAIGFWRQLIQNDPNSLEAQSLRAEIANAQRLLAESSGELASGPSIRVRVELGEGVDADPAWRVFVAARNADQEGMPPLAAVDIRVADLPTQIVLNDAAAVGPFNLSSAERASVSVLVSRAGTATPQTGDYRASSGAVSLSGDIPMITLVVNEQLD